VSADIKVKGSRFIGIVETAAQKEEAEHFIEEIRKIHHNATHNCFAYRIDTSLFRYSDDGEPSGTAGRPILNMIDKNQLKRLVLVVTRYFGGTKLGTGGLIRAYGEAAEKTLQQAKILKKNNYQKLSLEYPFDIINKVHNLVQKYEGQIREKADLDGMISQVKIFPTRREAFLMELQDLTSGKAKFKNE
jgi:uncharacterized YigZ family protein